MFKFALIVSFTVLSGEASYYSWDPLFRTKQECEVIGNKIMMILENNGATDIEVRCEEIGE